MSFSEVTGPKSACLSSNFSRTRRISRLIHRVSGQGWRWPWCRAQLNQIVKPRNSPRKMRWSRCQTSGVVSSPCSR